MKSCETTAAVQASPGVPAMLPLVGKFCDLVLSSRGGVHCFCKILNRECISKKNMALRAG